MISHLFVPILCWDWLTGGDLPEGRYIRSYFNRLAFSWEMCRSHYPSSDRSGRSFSRNAVYHQYVSKNYKRIDQIDRSDLKNHFNTSTSSFEKFLSWYGISERIGVVRRGLEVFDTGGELRKRPLHAPQVSFNDQSIQNLLLLSPICTDLSPPRQSACLSSRLLVGQYGLLSCIRTRSLRG